jgi:uncharacterized protein YggE
MSITIPIPKSNGTIIAKIYDGLAQVANINIYGMNLDLNDKTSAYIQARKLAYQDAVSRAKDYTKAAGVTLGNALSITDSFYANSYNYYSNSSRGYSSTAVSVGQVTINYNVNVIFGFK